MRSCLIIIQNIPTQFDVPLYAFMEREAPFNLKVFYTQVQQDIREHVDPEIGQPPQWDHLQDCHYDRKNFSAAEANRATVMAEEIVSHRPDLVILSGYTPLPHAKLAWLLKRKGIRIGLRSDNTVRHSNFNGIRGLIKKITLPFLLRYYDTWHPVGTLARHYFKKIANTERPTFLFPYNVDNDWFASESKKHRDYHRFFRKEMGFSLGDFVILGIMKWHVREDPLTLIDAFARLVSRWRNARLILVGDGPLRDEVYAKAETFGNKIFMPGYVPYSDLPKYYAESDVFVHPAVDECWGVSVNEAMACGVPVIASSGVGAAADLIKEWETGSVFPIRDSRLLAEKLSRLTTDRQLLLQMGQAARQKISEWNYKGTCRELNAAIKPETTMKALMNA